MRLLERPRLKGTAANPLGALFELVDIYFGNQEAGAKLQQLSLNVNEKLKLTN